MIKIECDGCGEEIARAKEFSYLCHIDEIVDGGHGEYIDSDGNATSGREETVQLCNKCYNEVMVAAVSTLREIGQWKIGKETKLNCPKSFKKTYCTKQPDGAIIDEKNKKRCTRCDGMAIDIKIEPTNIMDIMDT